MVWVSCFIILSPAFIGLDVYLTTILKMKIYHRISYKRKKSLPQKYVHAVSQRLTKHLKYSWWQGKWIEMDENDSRTPDPSRSCWGGLTAPVFFSSLPTLDYFGGEQKGFKLYSLYFARNPSTLYCVILCNPANFCGLKIFIWRKFITTDTF